MWLTQFEQLMSLGGMNNENIKKAANLKYNNMPDMFFKYRRISENTIKSFKNDTLYFSKVSNFNDPYECAMSLTYGYEKLFQQILKNFVEKIKSQCNVNNINIEKSDFLSTDILAEKINKKLNLPIDETKKTLIKLVEYALEMEKNIYNIGVENYRVCSFSEINDSLLMWSHYANNHEGFCLSYNFKELNNDLTELLFPVFYNDNLLDITELFLPDDGKINNMLFMYALSRKCTSWSYEKEWRIIVPTNNKEREQYQKQPIPKCIYLGTKMREEDKKTIIEIAKEKQIDVYQMVMKSNQYKLYSEKII